MTRLNIMLEKYGIDYVDEFKRSNAQNCKTCAHNPDKGFCVNMVYEETTMPLFLTTCGQGLIEWLNSEPKEGEVI